MKYVFNLITLGAIIVAYQLWLMRNGGAATEFVMPILVLGILIFAVGVLTKFWPRQRDKEHSDDS